MRRCVRRYAQKVKCSINVHIEFSVNVEKIRKGSISLNNPNVSNYFLFG